jgi:hypothetical protein
MDAKQSLSGQGGLMIGGVMDPAERAADQTADRVMRMPMSQPLVQRKCEACEGEEKKVQRAPEEPEKEDVVQAKAQAKGSAKSAPVASPVASGAGASAASPGAAKAIRSMGTGQPLARAERAFFEPRMGTDLSSVRVHDGPAADKANRSINARAFTLGNNVAFAKGEHQPGTETGRHLMAHELAHVRQSANRQSQLFRQAAIEPHYPTGEEQRKIEKALSRDFGKTEATTPATHSRPAANEPVAKKARALNAKQRRKLAETLRETYFNALDRLDSGQLESSAPELNETDALSVTIKAREKIFKRFGSYASRSITLTRDQTTTLASRHADDQVLVIFEITQSVLSSVARTIATTHCEECKAKLAGLDTASRKAVINLLTKAALQKRKEVLRRVEKARVPGSYSRHESRARLRLRPRDEFYGTAVHELIHALAHSAFIAAFSDEDWINEGFTEYFTRQIVGADRRSYQKQYNKIVSARDAMKGPFRFATVGGAATEESMRMAYFRGRLDLIGWRSSGPEEEQAVKNVDESTKQWDAATANRYVEHYKSQAQAKQGASRNFLGMGLHFKRGADDGTITVRYARVLGRTKPFAKGQFLLEGQLLGSPAKNPGTLGASLGVAVEYQEPHFYAGGGARFVGTAAPAGTDRLDISPFAGVGIRAWQTIRVGAEGFVLLPLTGQDIRIGGGITLGIEFK